MIAVAALEKGNGNKWKVPSWASSGDGVRNADLAMPGSQIIAAAVPGSYLVNAYPDAVFDTPDGLVIRGSGTSQAAALAAGAAATLLEARPDLTPDEVKAALTRTAWDVGVPSKFAGAGLVGFDWALVEDVTGATQNFPLATGLGSLEAARGSYHTGPEGDQLYGETTAFGDTWDPNTWTAATSAAAAYTNENWDGATWSSGSWLGATWSGATWSGATWSVPPGPVRPGPVRPGPVRPGPVRPGPVRPGPVRPGPVATWSGATWSGATWSGASWA